MSPSTRTNVARHDADDERPPRSGSDGVAYRVSEASWNSMFAKCIGASPTIKTAGHTGIPVGTDATKAAFAIGTGSNALATAGTTRRSCGGVKYLVVSIAM